MRQFQWRLWFNYKFGIGFSNDFASNMRQTIARTITALGVWCHVASQGKQWVMMDSKLVNIHKDNNHLVKVILSLCNIHLDNWQVHPWTNIDTPVPAVSDPLMELPTLLYSQLWAVRYGPLARYAKLRVVHARGMPGTFPPPPRVSRCWGKRSRHPRHMRNPRFCVFGKRPIPFHFLTHEYWPNVYHGCNRYV